MPQDDSDNKKWVTFTYLSPTIIRITDLFKHSNLKIAYRPTNSIQQQLTGKTSNKNPSGVHKLQCNTCDNVYIVQSGRSVKVRHKEHIRYIRTNNPLSAFAVHILQKRHEYRTMENTLQILKAYSKGKRMNCWEILYM